MRTLTAKPALNQPKPKAKKDFNFWMSIIIKIQGYICFVLFGLIFVYSLILPTPFAPLFHLNDAAHTYTAQYYATEPVINSLLIWAVIGCAIAALYKTFRNHERRIYYVSNYVYSGILAGYSFIFGLVTIVGSALINALYLTIDFTAVNAELESYHYDDMPTSISLPAFGYVLGILSIVVGLSIVGTMIYKAIKGQAFEERNLQ